MVTRSSSALVAVLGAQACALSAARMLLIAVPWLVLTSTGSPAQTGLVALCQTLPYVGMQIATGPLMDRIGPRRVAIAGDMISAVAMVLLAAAGSAPMWMLMVVMAIVGSADGPANAAKSILLPTATAAAGQPLERGTGLATAVERAATAGGPALAGLLIASYGAPHTLWLTAALLASASLISSMIRTDPAPPESDGNYFQRLRQGAAHLHQERSLRALTVMFVITNFLDQAFLTILLPVWAHSRGHSPAYAGLAIGVFAAAAVLTALITAGIGDRLNRRAVYLTGFLVAGVSRFVALALDLPPEQVLLVFAIAGLGSGAANPIIEAVQFERIPPGLRGRVRTLITAYAWAGIPVGGIAGAALLAAGLTAALTICGAVYFVAVAYPGKGVRWDPDDPDSAERTVTAGPTPPRPPTPRDGGRLERGAATLGLAGGTG
ncbi:MULTISPECIES: MFS transporter [Actinoplanes]|uniref:MFS transporter n=1 Tax=Actinoplanes TaxID=1865 RepID=UPI0007C77979|nr:MULTISPECIES: MFS transporter [Actinoplanes]GLY02683.1 putative drug antiporter protein precursor [Actinoplanes sp. NBRC 101535]